MTATSTLLMANPRSARGSDPSGASNNNANSVDIQPEWTMLEKIPFSTFSKLSFSVPEPEDLLFKINTTDDPIIRRLANEDKATVFATDSILSSLMCAPKSVYSWDIVIQRVGNKVFFDKRDGSQRDLLSVNETSQEHLPEAKQDINSAFPLSFSSLDGF